MFHASEQLNLRNQEILYGDRSARQGIAAKPHLKLTAYRHEPYAEWRRLPRFPFFYILSKISLEFNDLPK
jgi:hypothetical protein